MALKLAVLLSGSGTTLQNILDHSARGTLDAEVVFVLSSRDGVYGLERARGHNVPTAVMRRKDFVDTHTFSESVWQAIRPHNVDLVVLAGFMSLLEIPPDFEHRVINTHPALIPAFCGKGMYGHHVHEAVLAYGCKVSGATIHYVDEQYDHGPIILQESVPVLDNDTADSLADRVQAKERELYPRAIQLIAEGRLRIEGRVVRTLDTP